MILRPPVSIDLKWLFICKMNFCRGPTAEHIARMAGYWTDSVGTDDCAGKMISPDRVAWADIIVCMTEEERNLLWREFPKLLTGKSIFTWDVGDNYSYCDRYLEALCHTKLLETIRTLERLYGEENPRQEKSSSVSYGKADRYGAAEVEKVWSASGSEEAG